MKVCARNNVSKLDWTHSISEVLKLGSFRNNDIKPDRTRYYALQLDRTQLELEVPKQGNDDPDEMDGDQQPQTPSETNDEYAEEGTVHEDMSI
jgi:hypothetical protein